MAKLTKLEKIAIENRLLNRRQFLIGSGKTMLALPPLLSLMAPNVAAAVNSEKIIRTVMYISILGIDEWQLYPSATGLTLHPGAIETRYKKLTDYSGALSRIIDQNTFSSLYNKMNLMQGLSLCGGSHFGHHWGTLAACHTMVDYYPKYGKSADVIIEKSPYVYPSGTSIAHKAIRIQGTDFSFDRINGNRYQTDGIYGDRNLFNKLFPNGKTPGDVVTTPSPTTPAVDNSPGWIVDQVLEDLKSLLNNRKISSEEKILTQQHIDSVHELQKNIVANQIPVNDLPMASCPASPTFGLQSSGSGANWAFPAGDQWKVLDCGKMFDNYIQMIKIAFACDLTRVVLIGNDIWSNKSQWSDTDGGLHHDCASSNVQTDRKAWGIRKMANLAKELDSVSEASGGTILDNSTILCTDELGSWDERHLVSSIPSLMFGSGGGFFKTGYFVDYRQTRSMISSRDYTYGRPYKQLLQSIMQAAGVPKSEYIKYGDGKGFGEFVERLEQGADADAFSPYRNEHNDTLPFLVNS